MWIRGGGPHQSWMGGGVEVVVTVLEGDVKWGTNSLLKGDVEWRWRANSMLTGDVEWRGKS